MYFHDENTASSIFSEVEHAAREEILRQGGSLSHHHGVGKLRSSFLPAIDSLPWQDYKKKIKHAVDPENIFGARNGPFATNETKKDR